MKRLAVLLILLGGCASGDKVWLQDAQGNAVDCGSTQKAAAPYPTFQVAAALANNNVQDCINKHASLGYRRIKGTPAVRRERSDDEVVGAMVQLDKYFSINELQQLCAQSTDTARAACEAYVAGVIDAIRVRAMMDNTPVQVCPPALSLAATSVENQTEAAANLNGVTKEVNAAFAVAAAMLTAYPCAKP